MDGFPPLTTPPLFRETRRFASHVRSEHLRDGFRTCESVDLCNKNFVYQTEPASHMRGLPTGSYTMRDIAVMPAIREGGEGTRHLHEQGGEENVRKGYDNDYAEDSDAQEAQGLSSRGDAHSER